MLSATQTGTAGEQLFAAVVTLTSNGDLELFKPLTDDDHTDVAAGHRGGPPVLAIQVKTALSMLHNHLVVARMSFPEGHPREHPAFVYAILYLVDAAIDTAWLVPSADFNRLAYRGAGHRGKGIELEFMGATGRADKWTDFRCTRLELGPRLMAIADNVSPGPPPSIPGTHLLLKINTRNAS